MTSVQDVDVEGGFVGFGGFLGGGFAMGLKGLILGLNGRGDGTRPGTRGVPFSMPGCVVTGVSLCILCTRGVSMLFSLGLTSRREDPNGMGLNSSRDGDSDHESSSLATGLINVTIKGNSHQLSKLRMVMNTTSRLDAALMLMFVRL